MRTLDAEAALQQQIASTNPPMDEAALNALRACVCEYVDHQRRLEWPAERVVVALKRIARDPGLRLAMHPIKTIAGISALDELVAQMVSWAIYRYYEFERRENL
jgi:hypothetical protein